MVFYFYFFYHQFCIHMSQLAKQIKELIIQEKKLQQKFKLFGIKDFDKEIQFVTGNEWNAGNLSYHLKSRPKWEGFTNNEILNKSSQFICVDDVCLGRY